MPGCMSTFWPPLELDEATRKWVDFYSTDADPAKGIEGKPGVLRRTYGMQLVETSFPGEQSKLTDNFAPSGRYVRLFAMTFSGFLQNFQVKLASQSGELYIQDFTDVPSLLNMQQVRSAAMGGSFTLFTPESLLMGQNAGRPLVWDPAIQLEGTQELIVTAQTIAPVKGNDQRFVLNIAFHVWEFPDVPRMLSSPVTGQPTGRVQQQTLNRARAAQAKRGG